MFGLCLGAFGVSLYQVIRANQAFSVTLSNLFSLSLLFCKIAIFLGEFCILSDESAIPQMEPSTTTNHAKSNDPKKSYFVLGGASRYQNFLTIPPY